MEESIVTSNKQITTDFHSGNSPSKKRFYRQSKTLLGAFAEADYTQTKSENVSHKEESILTEQIIDEHIALSPDSEVTYISQKDINHEDSESLLNNIFNGRKFISSENWDSNEIIKSRIISADNDSVYLDCIVDIETMSFEHRQFPKSLFSNFKSLDTGRLAMINIKSNPGSLRVDVYPGEGIVSADLFDVNEDIQKLKERDVSTKLRGEW